MTTIRIITKTKDGIAIKTTVSGKDSTAAVPGKDSTVVDGTAVAIVAVIEDGGNGVRVVVVVVVVVVEVVVVVVVGGGVVVVAGVVVEVVVVVAGVGLGLGRISLCWHIFLIIIKISQLSPFFFLVEKKSSQYISKNEVSNPYMPSKKIEMSRKVQYWVKPQQSVSRLNSSWKIFTSITIVYYNSYICEQLNYNDQLKVILMKRLNLCIVFVRLVVVACEIKTIEQIRLLLWGYKSIKNYLKHKNWLLEQFH